MKQALKLAGGCGFPNLLQGYGFLQGELAAAGAGKLCQVSTAAEFLAQVVGQRADVGAGRALYLHREEGVIPLQKLQAVNLHPARLAGDFLALPGQLVEALSPYLDGRIHRRHLLDDAPELLQGFFDFFTGYFHLRHRAHNPALGIVGVGAYPQADYGPVGFGALHQEPGHPGGLAHAHQ